MKLLLADSGGTKTDWLFFDGIRPAIFQSKPLHPYFVSADYAEKILQKEIKPKLKGLPDQIIFYGAGCASASNQKKIRAVLRACFKEITVFVHDDLLGAARACLHDKSGIIAILGTGSNSGLYDGNKITEHVDSLGFILGDEGSGADLGKQVLKLLLRKELSTGLQKNFLTTLHLSRDQLLQKIYAEEMPNRFLASFTPWIYSHKRHRSISRMIENSFRSFIHNQISNYSGYKKYRLNAVGAVAYFFKNEWRKVAQDMGLQAGIILKSPLHELLDYHLEQLRIRQGIE